MTENDILKIKEVVRELLLETYIPKKGFTTKEVAKVLGVSPASVMRLRKRGLLKPAVALRNPIYSTAEIERFLNQTTA